MATAQPRHFTWLEVLISVLLVGVVSIELYLYSPAIHLIDRGLGVTVKAVNASQQSTRIELAVTHGSADRDLRLAAFPLSDRQIWQRSIFVFSDSRYPVANAIATAGQGVFDHLSSDLITHNYPQRIVAVNADTLRDLLMATGDATQRAVIIVTGVLPATVFSAGFDLLSPWVQAGGLAVWGGGTIGFWSATPGLPLSGTNALGELGTERLVGAGVVQYPTVNNRLGQSEGDFATALGISYQRTSAGVLRDAVLARGGLALGWYGGPFSSLSYLPRGQGAYLIFGGEILDEVEVSKDLARTLLSGSIYGSGPVASTEINLQELGANSAIKWDIPFPVQKNGIMLVAYDPTPDGFFFNAHVLNQ